MLVPLTLFPKFQLSGFGVFKVVVFWRGCYFLFRIFCVCVFDSGGGILERVFMFEVFLWCFVWGLDFFFFEFCSVVVVVSFSCFPEVPPAENI